MTMKAKQMNPASVMLVLLAMAAASPSPAADGACAPRKKIVGFGWGDSMATPSVYLAHADRMAEFGLDGALITLKSRGKGGGMRRMDKVWDREWKYEDFACEIPALRKMGEHPAYKELFILSHLGITKSRVDWLGDEDVWRRLAANMRVAARIAREGGLRGLAIDPEDYSKKRQFTRMPGEPSLPELRRAVRRRSAELFRGVFEEYPEATVFSLWMLSITPDWYASKCGWKDEQAIVDAEQSLWPAFVNGLLDVLPPTGKVVDGNENYFCDADKNRFYRERHWIRNGLRQLVAPENVEKYDRQMQVSVGIYLDMYVNTTNTVYYFPPKDGSRLETFRRNIVQALDACDEYVWVYGERLQFVKWDDDYHLDACCKRDRWEDKLPGLGDILRAEKDPSGFVKARKAELMSVGMWTNMVANGDCAVDGGGVPKPFGVWRPAKKDGGGEPTGEFGSDAGFGDGDSSSLCAEGVRDGCYTLRVNVAAPGEYYLRCASACGNGVSGIVAWRDAEYKYVGEAHHIPFRTPAGKWMRGQILVRAPTRAAFMCLNLSPSLAGGEKAWFDRVGMFRLTYSSGK